MAIAQRKIDHINICLKRDVESARGAGLEDVELLHNCLPGIALERIGTSCTLLGKRLAAPLLIGAITGGHERAAKINNALAAAAQRAGIAMCLGSQRAMLQSEALAKTYSVRSAAPGILLLGNIGVAQLRDMSRIARALSATGADALCVHLNALQEALQPEGDTDFSGDLRRIAAACRELPLPVVVKETGAGIAAEQALLLQDAGVAAIDVAGAGGTSWSAVESYRGERLLAESFRDWGIATAACIAEVARAVRIPVIASGGVRSGIDAAKCIALGASCASAALPFLRAADAGTLDAQLALWQKQLRIAMFLAGAKSVAELRKARVAITGRTAEFMRLRGIDVERFARR
jgi:isopentenyl-diphosphate delta-isomerase